MLQFARPVKGDHIRIVVNLTERFGIVVLRDVLGVPCEEPDPVGTGFFQLLDGRDSAAFVEADGHPVADDIEYRIPQIRICAVIVGVRTGNVHAVVTGIPVTVMGAVLTPAEYPDQVVQMLVTDISFIHDPP